MDKRFFLALFLSLVVIAISQLLFPPSKRPGSGQTALGKDSASSQSSTASSTQPAGTQASAVPAPTSIRQRATAGTAVTAVSSQVVAETTTVTTPKVIYKFSNVGAAPMSIVIRDYKNRSASGGLVDLGIPGAPPVRYRLVTPADTANLAQTPFRLSRVTNAGGDETLTYSATVRNLAV